MGPAMVKSYAWSLITSPYLPAGNTKSSLSDLIISISEPSPNGATLKSYDILRMVHVSCTFVVLAWPAVLNAIARGGARVGSFGGAPRVGGSFGGSHFGAARGPFAGG